MGKAGIMWSMAAISFLDTHMHTHTQKMKEQQIADQISEDFNLPMGRPPFN